MSDVNFKIGDFVRLGNDMPYQITTENSLKNVQSKPYRLAFDREINVAKMYMAYKGWGNITIFPKPTITNIYEALKEADKKPMNAYEIEIYEDIKIII